MQAVLQSRDVGLETRVVVIDDLALLAAGVTFYLAALIPYVYNSDKVVPAAIHLRPDDISQISSIASATEIHVATANNDATAFLVTQAPAPTTAPG